MEKDRLSCLSTLLAPYLNYLNLLNFFN